MATSEAIDCSPRRSIRPAASRRPSAPLILARCLRFLAPRASWICASVSGASPSAVRRSSVARTALSQRWSSAGLSLLLCLTS